MSKKSAKLEKEPIRSFAWSPSRDQMCAAVDDKVCIYDCKNKDPRKWTKLHSLDAHKMTVSCVDWSGSNQIVSCSHDRNAFVWTHDQASDQYRPKLVILRIDRAANMVKWSPDGKKFAIASSDKKVPICHFSTEQNFWISAMIKKHKSTVLCLDWHPNNQLIVTGACDFRCRIFCAYVDKVDTEQDNGPFEGKLDEECEFGDMICEFTAKGWIEAVAWSPSGKRLVYASHDSSLTIIDFSKDEWAQQHIKLECLPLRDVKFVSDTRILAVGYDFLPYLCDFDADKDEWCFGDALDQGAAKKKTVKSAHSIWQQRTKLGQDGAEATLSSKHDNTICCLQQKSVTADKAVFTSSGLDGRIYEWKVGTKK